MTKWSYPDTDEWKRWVYNSDWATLDSWEANNKRYDEKIDKIELKEWGILVLMVIIFMPALIIGSIIHPVLGGIAAIIDFSVIGYLFYLMYIHHKIAVEYDKGYPQSQAHPNKVYKEIQIRKKSENMEYDVAALGLIETIHFIRRKKT